MSLEESSPRSHRPIILSMTEETLKKFRDYVGNDSKKQENIADRAMRVQDIVENIIAQRSAAGKKSVRWQYKENYPDDALVRAIANDYFEDFGYVCSDENSIWSISWE